jgi:hypothetical protein
MLALPGGSHSSLGNASLYQMPGLHLVFRTFLIGSDV